MTVVATRVLVLANHLGQGYSISPFATKYPLPSCLSIHVLSRE